MLTRLHFNPQRGFTLIELMIVIAIIGILAAIVIPSYNEQVRKTRRTEAKVFLVTAAQQLEKCFTRFNSYAANTDLNLGCNDFKDDTSENGHYTISAAVQDANGFSLTLIPADGKSQIDDVNCAQMTINQIGTKTALAKAKEGEIPKNTTEVCWQ